MGTIADITSLLEKIPLWKQLKSLPETVARLEDRVVTLERVLAEDAPADRCPKCRKLTYELQESVPDPTFGRLGGNRRTYRCASCGFTEKKLVGAP